MPQTRDCDYCGSEIPPGTGTMFVRTDGTAIHYCSSKCEKNADLGREPRDVEWIQDEEAEQLRRAEEGGDAGEDETEAEEVEAETEEDEAEAEEADESETAEPEDDADAEDVEADEEREEDVEA